MGSSINLDVLWPQFENLLKVQGEQFLLGHAADVAILGEDVAKAILATTVSEHFETLVTPGADAGIDEIMAVEAILVARTAAFQLIATAESQHSAAVARVRAEALAVAKALGVALISIVGGMGAKAVLGV